MPLSRYRQPSIPLHSNLRNHFFYFFFFLLQRHIPSRPRSTFRKCVLKNALREKERNPFFPAEFLVVHLLYFSLAKEVDGFSFTHAQFQCAIGVSCVIFEIVRHFPLKSELFFFSYRLFCILLRWGCLFHSLI